MKTYRADRIEEEFLVCVSDSGDTVNIPLDKLPAGVGEGWIITVSGDAEAPICTVREPDADSVEKNRRRFDKLFGKKY